MRDSIMQPDNSKLVSGEAAVGDDELDTNLLREMNEEAKAFLLKFDWCRNVRRSFFGDGFGGIVATFLIEITPATAHMDEWLWVVVGDVPPAYLVTDEISDPRTALETYVSLMREWIDAVQKGLPTEELIPVNAPATMETAASLKKRLDTIEQIGLYEVAEKG
jgi:hypothetical protein